MDLLNCYNFINRHDLWENVFQAICKKSDKEYSFYKKSISVSGDNGAKNRYKDVIPYDTSRVVLKKEYQKSDYINASLLNMGEDKTQYILAQGPLKITVTHFWQMVWDQNTQLIIMLCSIIENGKEKCSKYYPDENTDVTHGDFKITSIFIQTFSSYVIRKFDMLHKKLKKSRTVIQVHFTEWPDFGIPSDCSSFLDFIIEIRESFSSSFQFPVIVHCSAGIGRTGTLILIDCIIEEIKQKNHFINVDPMNTLILMRKYRNGLIQTAEQFNFAFKCIIVAINKQFKQLVVDDSEKVSTILKLPIAELVDKDYIPFKSVNRDYKLISISPEVETKLPELRRTLVVIAKRLKLISSVNKSLPIRETNPQKSINVVKIVKQDQLDFTQQNSNTDSVDNGNKINGKVNPFSVNNKNPTDVNPYTRCYSVLDPKKIVIKHKPNNLPMKMTKSSSNMYDHSDFSPTTQHNMDDRPKRPENRPGVLISTTTKKPQYHFDAGSWFAKYYKYIFKS